MWLLFKETVKGAFYILFSISMLFFSIKEITKNNQALGMIFLYIFCIPLFALSAFLYAYYIILLPSKLKEGYSSLNEIMLSESYTFEKDYFTEKTLILEKRIYLDKIEKIIFDKDGDDETDDIFFDLLVEYELKKTYITDERSIAKFLEYFLETLEGFDKSIQSEKGIEISKIEKYPITLYEKNKKL